MKKIAKLLKVFMLVFLFAAFLAGCGSGEKETEITEIEYWSIFPIGDPYTLKHDELIKAFELANPDIKIKHVGTNFWDYFSKIRTAQSGGVSPDVSMNDVVNVKFRASAGVIQAFESFMKKDKLEQGEFLQVDIDAMSLDGKLYALPFSGDSRLLYYNKDHFKAAGLDPEKPPKTLEDIEKYTDLLTKYQDDSKKVLTQVGFHPRLGNNAIQQIVWPQGGSFFDSEGNPTVNDPSNIAPLEWWVRMCQKYPAKAMNAFSSQNSATKISPFIQGKVSMIIDGDWLAWDLEKNASEINYGVTSVPYSDEKYRATWSGGFTLEMSGQTKGKKAEAAWRFIRFMTGAEAQSKMIEYFSWVPSNQKTVAELLKTVNENQKFILNETKYRKHVEYCPGAPEWWSYVDPQIGNAEGKKKTVQQALDDAQNDLVTAIKNYNTTRGIN